MSALPQVLDSTPWQAADRTALEARAEADVAAATAASAWAALTSLRDRLPDSSVDPVDIRMAARLADRCEGLWAASEVAALRAAEAARSMRPVDMLRPG